jgi:hypothetical protein
MRAGRRNPGFEEGGADLFSELMFKKKTDSDLELSNSYQPLRDGVELLTEVMGEQWLLDSRNHADSNQYLRETLGSRFDAAAVEQLLAHRTNLGCEVSMRDWLELAKKVLSSPK